MTALLFLLPTLLLLHGLHQLMGTLHHLHWHACIRSRCESVDTFCSAGDHLQDDDRDHAMLTLHFTVIYLV